jgi:TrmH family RNA methyltransferase
MLTSPQNPRLQRVRALLEKRKQRDAERAFVVEGVRLAEDALVSGWQPELVLYSARLSARGQQVARLFQNDGAEVVEIAEHLMDSLAGTEAPQGLLAVFPMRPPELPEQLDFALIADNLRDPGNLGTLLRSAAAAGVQAVLLSPGTTDAFAPKVLRAGMGAHFRLPVLHASWGEIRAICKERATPLHILLAEADQGTACWDLDLRQPLALMVGNEAEGASPDAQRITDQPVTIPMPGRSESLNAAAAASVLLFEVVRQRRDTESRRDP